MMKAVLCTAFGPPEDLRIVDIPRPEAGPGEVVVEVGAAALNFFDTLIVAGKYQTRPPLPFSPGGELAGTVVAVGADVEGVAPGDRVMGHIGWGGARQFAFGFAADETTTTGLLESLLERNILTHDT